MTGEAVRQPSPRKINRTFNYDRKVASDESVQLSSVIVATLVVPLIMALLFDNFFL